MVRTSATIGPVPAVATHGVQPVCGKSASMAGHVKLCPLVPDSVYEEYRRRQAQRDSQTHRQPSVAPPITHRFTATPLQHTVSCPIIPDQPEDPGRTYSPPPKRARSTNPSSSHQIPSEWEPSQQNEFANDLCRLFISCNIAWNIAENAELHLFVSKWIPGAVIPDRRTLATRYLNDLITVAKADMKKRVCGRFASGQSDGWKDIAKTNVTTSLMTVDQQVSKLVLLMKLFNGGVYLQTHYRSTLWRPMT